MIVATDARRKSVLMNQDDGYAFGETWKTVLPYIYENEIAPKFRKRDEECVARSGDGKSRTRNEEEEVMMMSKDLQNESVIEIEESGGARVKLGTA